MKTGLFILLAGFAIMAAVQSHRAFGESSALAGITVVCKADIGVDTEPARQLCAEVLVFLKDAHPDRAFQTSDKTAPTILLTVTRANERAVGLAVTWQATDGTQTKGTDLSTSFFDKASDEQMRRTFLVTFFQHNPLPF